MFDESCCECFLCSFWCYDHVEHSVSYFKMIQRKIKSSVEVIANSLIQLSDVINGVVWGLARWTYSLSPRFDTALTHHSFRVLVQSYSTFYIKAAR